MVFGLALPPGCHSPRSSSPARDPRLSLSVCLSVSLLKLPSSVLPSNELSTVWITCKPHAQNFLKGKKANGLMSVSSSHLVFYILSPPPPLPRASSRWQSSSIGAECRYLHGVFCLHRSDGAREFPVLLD